VERVNERRKERNRFPGLNHKGNQRKEREIKKRDLCPNSKIKSKRSVRINERKQTKRKEKERDGEGKLEKREIPLKTKPNHSQKKKQMRNISIGVLNNIHWMECV
jgi:hypothetical protein